MKLLHLKKVCLNHLRQHEHRVLFKSAIIYTLLPKYIIIDYLKPHVAILAKNIRFTQDEPVGCACYLQAVTNVLGPDHMVETKSKAYLVEFGSEGVFGWIPTRRELINQFLAGTQLRSASFVLFPSPV